MTTPQHNVAAPIQPAPTDATDVIDKTQVRPGNRSNSNVRFEGVDDDSHLEEEQEIKLLPWVLGKNESTSKTNYLFGMKIN